MTASLAKSDLRFTLPEQIDEKAFVELVSTDGAPVSSKPYPWILHPVLDLLFGCGGIVWMIFLVHWLLVPAAQVSPNALFTLSAIGTVVLAESHIASTFLIVYRNSETRSRFALYTRWLALACVALAFGAMVVPGMASVLMKLYLLMVPHHFMAQAFGIAMLYCMKRGYKVSKWEREALLLFCRSVTVYAMLRQLTYKEWSPNSFIGIPVPFWGPLPDWICVSAEQFLFFATIVTCTLFLVRTIRTGELFPVPAQLTLLTGVSAFVMGPAATGVYWLYVSAFFHGAQYLMVITAQRIKEDGLPEGMSTHKIARRLCTRSTFKFAAAILLVSFTLHTLLPRGLQLGGVDMVSAFAGIFLAINFFHIITDGAIWKLRDPKVRAQLVS